MYDDKLHKQKGFIALTSAVIISAVLLTLATTVSATSFFSRFNALNSEYKRTSLGLAESCVNATLLKIAQGYGYTLTADPAYQAGIGVPVKVGSNTCTVKAASYVSAGTGKRLYTITTQGQYKGAFSNITITATGQDPASAPVVPPPTCAMSSSATSAPGGSKVIFSWTTSSNAASFSIDHAVAGPFPIPSGSTGQVTLPLSPGAVTYTGTAVNAGGQGQCSVVIQVTPPPPAPSCADSVMVLDRTGSLFGSNADDDERNAARALVDLYAAVTTGAPKVGVGSFGGLDGSAASVPSGGFLSSAFSTLKTTINSMMSNSSSVGSDLSAAITVGAQELNNTTRHVVDSTTHVYPQKVLILVSDGDASAPTSGPTNPTGYMRPIGSASDNGESWTRADGAYNDGGTDAYDPVSENDHERYTTFSFGVPSGASIKGIEAQTDAWITETLGTGVSVFSDNFGAGSTDSSLNEAPAWTEGGSNGAEKRAAGSGNDTASSDGGRFAVVENNSWICEQIDATGFNALRLSYLWRGDSDANQSDDDGIVEYRTGGSCNSSSWTQLQNHDLRTWSTWSTQGAFSLPTSLNNTQFYIRFRASSDTNEYFRVDGVSITGTPIPSTSCKLGVQVWSKSDNQWSNEKSVSLSANETRYTFGASNDLWGNTWTDTDFSTANFMARVHAIGNAGCSSTATAHLDLLQLNVTYAQPTTPSSAALAAAGLAKQTGGSINSNDTAPINIVAIHFGSAGTNNANQNFLQSLTSPSLLPISSIPSGGAVRSGTTVTVTTSAPHKLSVNLRVQISGLTSSLNGAFRVTSVPTPTKFTYTTAGSGSAVSGPGMVTPTNLFIAPSSPQMSDIFTSIGLQVCPAAAPQCSNTVDDDGDGFIDYPSDPSCTDATDNDEWTAPAAPTPPPPPPPPPNVSIGSWQEVPTTP
ncbi:MAG TPA: hypothetical protein VHD31_02030 [Candidatus Paceibacterota bacterium]|nr:hypothetical protein [Candidatus Paceibacterota bacterium]